MDTPREFRHGSGTFRHNKKEPIIGPVPKTGLFLKTAAEFSNLFQHGSGTWRHGLKQYRWPTSISPPEFIKKDRYYRDPLKPITTDGYQYAVRCARDAGLHRGFPDGTRQGL
jgi:hypothetical protein